MAGKNLKPPKQADHTYLKLYTDIYALFQMNKGLHDKILNVLPFFANLINYSNKELQVLLILSLIITSLEIIKKITILSVCP